tara:strand:+ start:414 stop:1652 length:1239 start_codon:yes stop_codon:yes gene_type:complete
MDENIDFSNISQEFARIKTEVKNNLVNEFNKMPQLNIENNKIEEQKDFQFSNISWKTYRSVSILILFSSIFFSHFLKLHFDKSNTDPYLNMVLNILLLFFIFNLAIFLFYKTYYKYITSKKGAKGKSGKRGTRGIPGKNDNCDISTRKIGNFVRDKKIFKKEIIEDDEDTIIDFDKLEKMKKGWYNINSKNDINNGGNITNNIIGISCNNEQYCRKFGLNNKSAEKKNKTNNNDKPIIGAMVNYNKNTNKVIAIQYLYDRNKTHTKHKHNIGNFGSTSNNINAGTLGDYNNQSKGIEKHNFSCPKNSAIYKVEGMYDNEGMRGLKFHCQDITTGKLVKSYNNNNKKVYGVTFGLEPNPGTDNYHYDKSECSMFKHNNKYYPTFISNIGGQYDKQKKNIQNMSFNKCSFYYND